MGILKKSNAPSELPDLAIDSIHGETAAPAAAAPVQSPPAQIAAPTPVANVQPVAAAPVAPAQKNALVAGEDYLEIPEHAVPSVKQENVVKAVVDANIEEATKSSRAGFFDQVLNDINGEIKDLGNLEEWYEKKFLKQDVVSNMKGYWEGNKADILIESFGAEYKKQINEKVQTLKGLEEDWREIYFKLIKKEEEMKKEERDLKETLSEFVDLCKGSKNYGEKKEGSEEEE